MIAVSVVLADVPTWVRFQCRVRYSVLVGTTGFRVGLQFTQLDPTASSQLKQILGR